MIPSFNPPQLDDLVVRLLGTNGLNQQTQAGATALGYDGRGNLTTSGSRTYGYNKLNQLTSGPGTTLSYDPAGRMTQVTGSSGTTRFAYAGGQMKLLTKSGQPFCAAFVKAAELLSVPMRI